MTRSDLFERDSGLQVTKAWQLVGFWLAYNMIGDSNKRTVTETRHLFSYSQISNGVNLIPTIAIKENRCKGEAALVYHICENSLIVAIDKII